MSDNPSPASPQSAIHGWAIARARVVQLTIDDLRDRLDYRSNRQFRDVGQTYDDLPNAALLASYDCELTRLCRIPSVLEALLMNPDAPPEVK